MKGAARRLVVPEVVQTSTMDCGPAALKCLLEGFDIPVSYGRLREACQTDVDGTSIDTIEVVANQLGIAAEQVMLPADHLFLQDGRTLPALVVVRQPGGGTHFVVVWRRVAGWLQVMDPANGQRWIRRRRFMDELYRHETGVPAEAWRSWAASDAFQAPLRARMARLTGINGAATLRELSEQALADPGWFGLATLDAGVRLVQSIVDADGIEAGAAATSLLAAMIDTTRNSPFDIFKAIPPSYWTVTPDLESTDPVEQRLRLRGAALLHVPHRLEPPVDALAPPLSPELTAALLERPAQRFQAVWEMLKGEGLFRPLALGGAVGVAVGALLLETLLFRALMDVSGLLSLGSQRLAAILAVLAFAALLLVMQVPVVTESMRLGRHFEVRLRMALLRKLPLLADRYFQSRPISDMADRSHAIHATRLLPGMAVLLVQALFELLLTLGGIVVIDPRGAGLAIALAVAAVGIPAATQPLFRERDLRVRNHTGALGGFYLDALLGLVPVRAHRAEGAVQRQHEALLVEWLRAGRARLNLSIVVDGVQSLLCLGLSGALLFQHFRPANGVSGGDLLLVFWTLKLPAIGHGLTALAQQLPAQQNALSRLLEPLSAPEEEAAQPETRAAPVSTAPVSTTSVSIAIAGGSVVAAGHTILHDIDLVIAPGEHVAIVGASGAGKSTLVALLLGWHRLSAGTLLVDSRPLDSGTRDALRRSIAWVDPAIQIWNRNLGDNLLYSAENAGLERIGEILEAAALRDVLRGLPNGLQTSLGEGGAMLSGGEGQRVRLGRAFAQQGVRLALLDEPFRRMDRVRRAGLLADARGRWKQATLLCVTHDVGETRLFDRVLVVEGGRIIEDGAPERLAAAPSRYQSLLRAETEVLSQLWESGSWRRIAIRDGKAHEAA